LVERRVAQKVMQLADAMDSQMVAWKESPRVACSERLLADKWAMMTGVVKVAWMDLPSVEMMAVSKAGELDAVKAA
jgi:hypothetical protein